MKVPPLDLVAQYKELKPKLLEEFSGILDTGQFIMGDKVQSFETEVEKLLKVRNVIAVSSGTDALWLALRASGVGESDYVVTTPFTFFATVSAICQTGAKPLFCDIDERTYNINPQAFEELVERHPGKIRAVIPVHLYGQCADMDPINETARANGIAVIEDAAQAIGAAYHGRLAGSLGDIACFSLFPTKNLGALGDAGFVTTNSDDLADQVRKLRVHGSSEQYFHQNLGGNCRMDALQAAFLLHFLPQLPHWNQTRLLRSKRYNAALSSSSEIQVPFTEDFNTHVFHQYTVRTDSSIRDNLRDYLRQREIIASVYYPLPCHIQPALKSYVDSSESFPVTERISKEVLSLPIFPTMSDDQQDYVIETLISGLKTLGAPILTINTAQNCGTDCHM